MPLKSRKQASKKIVFSCPEGYRTFKLDYPNYVDLRCEVQHISECLAEKIGQNGVRFKEIKKKVTYQDPCRLGRHLGVYDAPRKVIKSIPGIELVEMAHSGLESICCGTSAFTNCDSYSNMLRAERLCEATETGAELLITACPKCQTPLCEELCFELRAVEYFARGLYPVPPVINLKGAVTDGAGGNEFLDVQAGKQFYLCLCHFHEQVPVTRLEGE